MPPFRLPCPDRLQTAIILDMYFIDRISGYLLIKGKFGTLTNWSLHSACGFVQDVENFVMLD